MIAERLDDRPDKPWQLSFRLSDEDYEALKQQAHGESETIESLWRQFVKARGST
jgi:hypothetical protein